MPLQKPQRIAHVLPHDFTFQLSLLVFEKSNHLTGAFEYFSRRMYVNYNLGFWSHANKGSQFTLLFGSAKMLHSTMLVELIPVTYDLAPKMIHQFSMTCAELN